MSEIKTQLYKLISDQLGVSLEEITDASSFIDDLGADSLDTVEFIMSLEDAFGLEIEDEEADKIITVGDVVELISKSDVAA